MNTKQRWWRLPHPALLLWLVATAGICAASDQPSPPDDPPTMQVGAEYTVAMETAAIREMVAAMPNAQVVQLITEARSLSPLEVVRAEQLYRQALALLVSEADQPHRWGVLYLLSRALESQKRMLEAEALAREAHTIASKYHPPDSTAVFETTVMLAMHTARTDRAAALTLASQAEQLIERKSVRRELLDLALDRLSVGDVLYALEERERSEKLLLAVLKDPDYEQLSYYHRARLLGRLGMISDARKDTAQAIDYLEQSLAVWAKTPMKALNHYEIGVNHLVLAEISMEQQDLVRTEKQSRLAAEEFKISGRDHSRAGALTLLGKTLFLQRRYTEARGFLADGYELHQKTGSNDIGHAANLYGSTLMQLKDFAGAASALHDAQQRYSKMPGHEIDTANIAFQRAKALWLGEQFCDARDALQEASTLLDTMPTEQRIKSAGLQASITKIRGANIDALCAQHSAGNTVH